MIPIGPGRTVVFNEHGKKAIETFARLAHYILLITTGKEDDGMVVIPILHGEGVIDELRRHMRQYFVAKKDAKKFLRLYLAHQRAIDAGLYKPELRARLVSLKATRPFPIPKDVPL